MTLKEAISHIQSAEKCDENTALQQSLAALAVGAVASSWALDEAFLNVSGATLVSSRPIVDALELRQFWLSRFSVDLECGTITDGAEDGDFEDDELDAAPPRSIEDVWVLKGAIFEHWTDGLPERATTIESKASEDEILDALRDIFKDVEKGKIKCCNLNILHTWVEDRVEPKRAPRKLVWKLFEKAPELSQYQRGKGRPSKEK